MPGIPVKPKVLTELQRQLNQELGAAHSYLALAAWCDVQNLKGFARFFSKQSTQERQHAQKFLKHLLDRSVLPVFTQVPAPPPNFNSLLDVATHAQHMERANTVGINACYTTATHEQHFPAQIMLHEFIAEQVEEEDQADEMVERIQMASCPGSLGDLDRHLDRYLTEESVNAAKSDPSQMNLVARDQWKSQKKRRKPCEHNGS